MAELYVWQENDMVYFTYKGKLPNFDPNKHLIQIPFTAEQAEQVGELMLQLAQEIREGELVEA